MFPPKSARQAAGTPATDHQGQVAALREQVQGFNNLECI